MSRYKSRQNFELRAANVKWPIIRVGNVRCFGPSQRDVLLANDILLLGQLFS